MWRGAECERRWGGGGVCRLQYERVRSGAFDGAGSLMARFLLLRSVFRLAIFFDDDDDDDDDDDFYIALFSALEQTYLCNFYIYLVIIHMYTYTKRKYKVNMDRPNPLASIYSGVEEGNG